MEVLDNRTIDGIGANVSDGICLCKNLVSRRLASDSDDDDDDSTTNFNDSEVLRNTLILYGGIFVGAIIVFCFVRRLFPSAYNVRNTVHRLKTNLAEDQHGFFSWAWKVWDISEAEFLQECGVDATCYLRILNIGFRLSLVGLFCSIWLLPTYYTADYSSDNEPITDWLVKTTIAHVPSGDNRLYATVFASYVFFLYSMRLVLNEFQWFINIRHQHLRRPIPRHFTVLVRNIPAELEIKSNAMLAAFFRKCFSDDAVLEARLPLTSSNLNRAISMRDRSLADLEHSLALLQKTGERPTHREQLMGMHGDEVDSIEYYTQQLEERNAEVSRQMEALEAIATGSQPLSSSSNGAQTVSNDPLGDPQSSSLLESSNETDTKHQSRLAGSEIGNSAACGPSSGPSHFVAKTLGTTTAVAKKATTAVTTAATQAATGAVDLVMGREDGIPYSAGFVVFSKLSTSNAALQMIHHETPFSMRTLEAPDPEDVVWKNVGRTHKDLQSGKVISIALTVTLCLVWTIPTSFIASLSHAEDAREDVGWLDDLFDKYPNMTVFIELVAPLLLVILNSILPAIFGLITRFEGHIGSGTVQASKFIKLAAFMIIQTFFVSAVSGTVTQSISSAVEDPSQIVEFLATTLPSQGTYFVQLVIIITVQFSSFELLRVIPIIFAAVRGCVGPRLTEKERSKRHWGFLRPLSDPLFFQQAFFASQIILFYVILMVYCPLYPLAPLVTAICFQVMGSVCRHQFIYIYPTKPDSGGKFLVNFVQFILLAMFLAQLTIVGMLALNKAPTQVALYIPLLCITVLFILYMQQLHFRVARYLPTHACLEEDLARGENPDLSFLHGTYIQPALAAERNSQPDPSLMSDDLVVET